MMRRNASYTILVISIAAILLFSLCACVPYSLPELKMEYEVDDSIPMYSGDKVGSAMTGSPDRGFAVSTAITLDESRSVPRAFPNDDTTAASAYFNSMRTYYTEYSPSVAYVTVYLTNYIDKKLTDAALSQLGSYLTLIKNSYMSCTLTFSYGYEGNDVNASLLDTLDHIAAIGDWLYDNITLATNTVNAVNASFMGVDGDLYTEAYSDENKTNIINNMYTYIPFGIRINVPNVSVKNMTTQSSASVDTGFYNDRSSDKRDGYYPGGESDTSKLYHQYINQAVYTYNTVSIANDPNIGGRAFLKELRNGSVSNIGLDGDNTALLLDNWKNVYISEADLIEAGLPHYGGWFKDAEGNGIDKSVYDYIRDFTGYHLSLSNLKVTTAKDEGGNITSTAEFVMTNYGLAAPLMLDTCELVIWDNKTNKQHKKITLTDFEVKKLTTYGQIKFTIPFKGDINDDYALGLRVYRKKSSRTCYAKLNNDVPFDKSSNTYFFFNKK